jgi:putative membrane protein
MCGWGGNGWMWNGGDGGGWGWGWGGWILTAVELTVLFAVIITASVWAVRHLTGASPRSEGGAGSGAEDVLGERFARGEIDDEEFRRRMTALREHR